MRTQILACVTAAASICVSASSSTDSVAGENPRYISLFIGIADYQHFSKHGPAGQTDLEGPLNDIGRMRASLRRWGFDNPNHTRVITNENASRAGILQSLDWLAETTRDSGDVVVLYYSGHGSFARDNDGDEKRLAAGDTLDEGLVPWDAQHIHDPRQLVLDDDIRDRLAKLKTRNITVLLDACYSGTATRASGQSVTRRAKGPVGPATSSNAASSGNSTLDLLHAPGHTLITAAGAQQLADEQLFRDEQKVFGAFTYYLTRVLDAAPSDARYDEVMQEVRLALSGAFLLQTPQLEGDQSARLFNVRTTVARRPFAVVRRQNDRLVIDLGAIHGVRESSIFDVFPPTETKFSATPLTQLRVDSVLATTAHVSLVSAGHQVVDNARAVLTKVPRGAKTLSSLQVYVDGGSTNAAMEKVGFITATNDSAGAETRIRGGQVFVRGIPLPSLPDDSSVCGKLKRAFAIASLELIQNPQPPREIDVQMSVVRSGSEPREQVTHVDTTIIGETVDIFVKVSAPANAKLFLTAAVAGYSSPAMLIYPDGQGAPPLFPLNKWVRILNTPIEKPAGIEIIKVVVGTDPFDFNALITSLPDCGRARSTGPARWNSGSATVSGWKTLEHQLFIRPSR